MSRNFSNSSSGPGSRVSLELGREEWLERGPREGVRMLQVSPSPLWAGPEHWRRSCCPQHGPVFAPLSCLLEPRGLCGHFRSSLVFGTDQGASIREPSGAPLQDSLELSEASVIVRPSLRLVLVTSPVPLVATRPSGLSRSLPMQPGAARIPLLLPLDLPTLCVSRGWLW